MFITGNNRFLRFHTGENNATDGSMPMNEKGASADWMKHGGGMEGAMNKNEATSISALVAYVAHTSGQSEFAIEREIADRFSVPNIKCLKSEHYEPVIRLLVEMAE